jgi:hypothetical protein
MQMAKEKTARDRHEESLRDPEPRSYMFIIATIVWIALTGALMWAVAYYLSNARGLPRLFFIIPVVSASLYGVVAHQNRGIGVSID